MKNRYFTGFFYSLLAVIGSFGGKILISRYWNLDLASKYFFLIDTVVFISMLFVGTKDPLIKYSAENTKKLYINYSYFFVFFNQIIVSLLICFVISFYSNIDYIDIILPLLSLGILIFFANIIQSQKINHIVEKINFLQITIFISFIVINLLFDSDSIKTSYLSTFFVISNLTVAIILLRYVPSSFWEKKSAPFNKGLFKDFYLLSLVATFEFLAYEGLMYFSTFFTVSYYDNILYKVYFQAISKPIYISLVSLPGFVIYRLLLSDLSGLPKNQIYRKYGLFRNKYLKILTIFFIFILLLLPFTNSLVILFFGDKFDDLYHGFNILLLAVPLGIYSFLQSATLKSLHLHHFVLLGRLLAIITLALLIILFYKFNIFTNIFIEISIALSSIVMIFFFEKIIKINK